MVSSSVLGGTEPKVTRALTPRALHDRTGALRVPRATRSRNSVVVMLAWAAALGVFLGWPMYCSSSGRRRPPASR